MGQLYTPYDANAIAQTPVFTAYFMGGAFEVSGTLIDTTFTQTEMVKYYAIAGMTVAVNDGSGLASTARAVEVAEARSA